MDHNYTNINSVQMNYILCHTSVFIIISVFNYMCYEMASTVMSLVGFLILIGY
jgi:hypothetical protein